jgi:hypothetical protein
MGTAESYSSGCMAMLQHYGAPSGTLDVSFDRRVALWFACHSYHRDRDQAFYSRNPNSGIVYVMEVPEAHLIDIRGGDTIELETQFRSTTVPLAGLRGWRQEGGLIFGSDFDDPDLTKYVVKKIAVAPAAFAQNDDRLKLLTQQRLFPSPDEDDFYRELLRAKDSDHPATWQLASFIPLYVVR